MRIGVYISGKSNRLLKYLNMKKGQDSGICYVFSDESIDEKLADVLRIYDIDYSFVEYNKMGTTVAEKRLAFSEHFLNELEKREIDYCFSFGEHILVGTILQKYKNKIINFHPAILPMYKGNKAIDQAVADNSAMLVGNTAHFVDEGVDTGMIIMQSVIPLKAFFDRGNDYDIILDLQIEMLDKIIRLINLDRIKILDNKVEISGADYYTAHIYPNVL